MPTVVVSATKNGVFSLPPWERYIGTKLEVIEKLPTNEVFSVTQTPLWLSMFDGSSRQLIAALRKATFDRAGVFREAGAWQIYTDKGVYASPVVTGSAADIENRITNNALEATLAKVRAAEGGLARIQDIEWYHTHPVEGEPLSIGDQSYQGGVGRYLRKKIGFPRSFVLAFHALAPTGNLVFRRV